MARVVRVSFPLIDFLYAQRSNAVLSLRAPNAVLEPPSQDPVGGSCWADVTTKQSEPDLQVLKLELVSKAEKLIKKHYREIAFRDQ